MTATPNQPATVPVGDEREAIARIIDPAVWNYRDDCLSHPKRFEDVKGAWAGMTFEQWANRGTSETLAKADAILARLSPDRGQAEAWAKLAQLEADQDARDEIITALCGGIDAVDAAADKWVELTEVRRSTQAIASVFAGWASDDIMQRFIRSMVALQHLAFGEGYYIAHEVSARLSPQADRGQAMSTPDDGGRTEAEWTVRDALMDSQYMAGVTAGWNAAQDDNPDAALASLQASRAGHLAGFKEAKAILAATPYTPGVREALEALGDDISSIDLANTGEAAATLRVMRLRIRAALSALSKEQGR